MEAQETYNQSNSYFWDENDLLGRGSFGNVYEGKTRETGKRVAVKVLNARALIQFEQNQKRLIEIILTIQKSNHKNIVKFIGIENLNIGGKAIIMEYCSGGSLDQVLKEPKNYYGLHEDEFLTVIKDVTAGYKYLRDNEISHRDLKPLNIMRHFEEDGTIIYKLIDFDTARVLNEGDEYDSLNGTLEYLHPSLFKKAMNQRNKNIFRHSYELWSLGVTFYQFATRKLPFKPFLGRKDNDTMLKIISEKERGVICAYQEENKNGPIKTQKELPKWIQLSPQLQKIIVPFITELFDDDLNFESYFAKVENILERKILHIFSFGRFNSFRLYLDPKDCKSLKSIQQEIQWQTNIALDNQILFHNNELLTNINKVNVVKEKASTINVEEEEIFIFNETSEENPIILFDKSALKINVIKNDRDRTFEKIKENLPNYRKNEILSPKKEYNIARDIFGYYYEIKVQIDQKASYISQVLTTINSMNQYSQFKYKLLSHEIAQLINEINTFGLKFFLLKSFPNSCQDLFFPTGEEEYSKEFYELSKQIDEDEKDAKNIAKILNSTNEFIKNTMALQPENLGFKYFAQSKKDRCHYMYETYQKRASILIKDINCSFKIMEKMLHNWKTVEVYEKAYAYERLTFQNHCQKILELHKECQENLPQVLLTFSCWFERFVQLNIQQFEEILKVITTSKESLKTLNDKVIKKNKKIHNFVTSHSKSIIKNWGKMLKKSAIKEKLSELKNEHKELREEFEKTQELCSQFNNLLSQFNTNYCQNSD